MRGEKLKVVSKLTLSESKKTGARRIVWYVETLSGKREQRSVNWAKLPPDRAERVVQILNGDREYKLLNDSTGAKIRIARMLDCPKEKIIPRESDSLKWIFDTLKIPLAEKRKKLKQAAAGAIKYEKPPNSPKSFPPPDSLATIKKNMSPAAIQDAWKRLQADPNYFPGGHLRKELRDMLYEDFRPMFDLVKEIEAALNAHQCA